MSFTARMILVTKVDLVGYTPHITIVSRHSYVFDAENKVMNAGPLN